MCLSFVVMLSVWHGVVVNFVSTPEPYKKIILKNKKINF